MADLTAAGASRRVMDAVSAGRGGATLPRAPRWVLDAVGAPLPQQAAMRPATAGGRLGPRSGEVPERLNGRDWKSRNGG